MARMSREEQITLLETTIRNTKIPKHVRDQAQEILDDISAKSIEGIQEQRERELATLEQQAKSSRESERKRKRIQDRCSHMKENPITSAKHSHLGGQVMHDGTMVLVCQHCGKVFADPSRPEEGWDPIPTHLIPHSSSIGSVMDPGLMVQAARQRKLAERAAEERPVNRPDAGEEEI